MQAPTSFGALSKLIEIFDARQRVWRGPQSLRQTMRRCVKARGCAARVGLGIFVSPQQSFVAFGQWPRRLKDERFQIALVHPKAILPANASRALRASTGGATFAGLRSAEAWYGGKRPFLTEDEDRLAWPCAELAEKLLALCGSDAAWPEFWRAWGGREEAQTHAPFFRRVGREARELARAWFTRVQKRARIGFSDSAGFNQDEPPQHRLGAAEPRGHLRVRLARERVPLRDRSGIAEEHVQCAQKHTGKAPQGGWCCSR